MDTIKDMTQILIKFIISILSLIFSAYFLLKFSEKLSSRIKISPLIVGVTLVAIGTSLPETFVAISAIIQGAPLISFGDIIGSNILNVCLVMGISILLFPVRIGTTKTQKNNIILLFLTSAFTIVFFLPEVVHKFFGILLLAFYVVFIITEIVWGEKGGKKEDKKALAKLEKSKRNPFIYIAAMAVSIAVLIISSKFLVSSVIAISQMFNINQEIIGLSLVALGTSLPELATTIASGLKKEWKLLYGDVQGSNIFNLSVIGAILIVFGGSFRGLDTFSLIFMASVLLSVVFLSHKYMGKSIPRVFGALYLLAYAFYIFKIYRF